MPKQQHMQIIADQLIENLKKRHMEGHYFHNKEDLIAFLDEDLKSDETITSGGSATLKELGVIDYLSNREDVKYLDRGHANNRDEVEEIMRKAFTSDSFFMSTNAITRDGILVNIDGNGNRVSALIFGPKKVYVICGTNKICGDYETAYARTKDLACPPNCIRLDMNTPCAKTGKCANCISDDCICNQIVYTRNSRQPNRIKVLIIDGEWGF